MWRFYAVCSVMFVCGLMGGVSAPAQASSYATCMYDVEVQKVTKHSSPKGVKDALPKIDVQLLIKNVFLSDEAMSGCQKVGDVLHVPIGNRAEFLKDKIQEKSRMIYEQSWLDMEDGTLRMISMYVGRVGTKK